MAYALVRDNVVVEIKSLTSEELVVAMTQYPIVVDITDAVPIPAVGWTFDGNKLVSNGTTSMKISKLAFRARLTTGELS